MTRLYSDLCNRLNAQWNRDREGQPERLGRLFAGLDVPGKIAVQLADSDRLNLLEEARRTIEDLESALITADTTIVDLHAKAFSNRAKRIDDTARALFVAEGPSDQYAAGAAAGAYRRAAFLEAARPAGLERVPAALAPESAK